MCSDAAVLVDITQGRRVWRQRARGFGAQLVAYKPRYEMTPHSHRTANITVVLAGSFEEELDGHGHLCEPLSVVVKPAGSVHATLIGDIGMRSLVVEVDSALEDEMRRQYGLFEECQWYHEPSALAACVLGLCRELRQAGQMTDGMIDRWFTQLGEAAASAQRKVRRARPAIHVDRALEIMRRDRSVSTTELAKRLRLHPVYLARLFRERLGHSPTQMRHRLRLSAALNRIMLTDQSLARVALGSGFADQSHMSRHVKRHAGMPAGALRRLGD